MLNTVFNALTPQIIRVTVDSVIGEEPFMLPQTVKEWLHLEQGSPLQLLLIAALSILIVAVLAGVTTYANRMTLAKGSENFVKALRDKLYAHIQNYPLAGMSRIKRVKSSSVALPMWRSSAILLPAS